MMTKSETAAEMLSRIGVNYDSIELDGITYCVTSGTGEREFGDGLGGSAAFAYDAEDETNIEEIESYGDFCDAFSPTTGVALGVAVAMRLGRRLAEAGACDPVLTDDEFLVCNHPAVSIDLVQGQDDRKQNFGYVSGDDGGFFFTWLPTLEETIDSVDEDQQDGDGGLRADVVREVLRIFLPSTKRGRSIWGTEND